jgi:hypothetical protein
LLAVAKEKPMRRHSFITLLLAASCLITAPAQSQTLTAIPSYFFGEWTVSKVCAEVGTGQASHAPVGLKLIIANGRQPTQGVTRSTDAAVIDDGTPHELQTVSGSRSVQAVDWGSVQLQYRPGTRMATLPADFECIPGEEASSPLLAMSDFAQSAEPYYEYEHWYGVVDLQGVPHHLLIFPRDVKGATRAVVVLQDMTAGDRVHLDHDGVIHTED